MYKIFINDKPFVLSSLNDDTSEFEGIERIHFDSENLINLIKAGEEMKFKGLILLCIDVEKALVEFKKHFISIEASGGIVLNNEKKLLLIKRFGKWDLPKGKIDLGESNEEAALREVEEECGVSQLSIVKEYSTTFHTYKNQGHRFFKITYWYLMNCKYTEKLVPQLEESITEAIWQDLNSFDLKETDSYWSIKDLLKNIVNLKK